MNKLSYIITFAAGATVGSVATWFYLKKKYEQLVQEEIKSVKETFKQCFDKDSEEKSEDAKQEKEEVVSEPDQDYEVKNEEEDDFDYSDYKDEYENIIDEEGYGETLHQPYANRPYVITPEEFGDMDGYDTAGMSYYADTKLADDKGHIAVVDETIGSNNLHYFGEYEEDMLYVRNPITKTDYEVFLDPRKYSDVYPGRV